jgi:hypothetical protein
MALGGDDVGSLNVLGDPEEVVGMVMHWSAFRGVLRRSLTAPTMLLGRRDVIGP